MCAPRSTVTCANVAAAPAAGRSERTRGRRAWSIASMRSALVDDEPTSLAIGMVLSEPPAAAPPDVEVRRVETDDEFYEAERIAAIAFGMSEPPKRRPYEPDPNNIDLPRVRRREARRPRDPPRSGSVARRCSAARRCRRRADAAHIARSSPPAGTTLPREAPRCSSRRPGRCPSRSWHGSGSATLCEIRILVDRFDTMPA